MKNTTKIIATVIITALVITGVTSTYAMGNANGQGNGQGQGMGKNQGLKQGHSMKTHIPADILKDVPMSDLSAQETQDLYYQYNEEKVARDAYNYFYSLYGTQTFLNIANSEQEHMDAVKALLDRYSLQTPTNYGELQSTFDTLKAEGEKGLKEALEVGLKIEILDINDIVDTIKTTDNNDLKIVFTNIGGASYNHMRGFLKALNSNKFTTDIDYSKYLSQKLVDSTGSLKYLLSEKLTAEGVVLPSQVNSSNIKANCSKEQDTLNLYYALKDYLSGLFR